MGFKRFPQKIQQYNQPLPLVDYLVEMVGDKKAVKILDVGSGPYPLTGQLLDGVKVEVINCDKTNFDYFWEKYEATPVFPITVQDMEALTYEDNTFDIVQCVNAMDHTPNAFNALKEMVRVCKPGGWVYINCALIQHTTRGGKHYWDALEDGTFTNGVQSFNLKNFGFTVEHIDNGDPRPYQLVIAKLQK